MNRGFIKWIAASLALALSAAVIGLGTHGQKASEEPAVKPPSAEAIGPSDLASAPRIESRKNAAPNALPASASPSSYEATKADGLLKRAMRYGYSQFIDAAIDSQDPQKSFEAAKILDACKSIDRRIARSRKHASSQTGPGRDSRELIASLKDDENVQRYCQTLTAVQQSQYLKLLETAAVGGTLGAASTHYHEVAVVLRQDPSAVPWQLGALTRDANHGDITAIKALGCDKIGAALSEKQRQTYRAALRIAATGGRAEEHASMLAEFCGEHSDSVAAVDTRAVQKLLTAIERVGTDYLENR